MKHLHAIKTQPEQGFTLLEITITIFIAGILAAISAPSVLGWLNRLRVERGLTEVRGALQEAQRSAIRSSTDCTITINSTTVTSTDDTCTTTRRSLPDGVEMNSNLSSDTVTFNFRGETGVASSGTIVIYKENNLTVEQQCLVISAGIGLIRTGEYSGDITSPKSDDCI